MRQGYESKLAPTIKRKIGNDGIVKKSEAVQLVQKKACQTEISSGSS